MNKILAILSFVFAFLWIAGGLKAPESKAEIPSSDSPLQITISIAKDTFAIGQEIAVKVVYKNISRQPIRVLGLTVWAYPLTFEVLDSNGKHSVTCRAPRYKRNINYDKDFIELKPQETLQRSIDINQYFLFKNPDTYQIKAYYTGFWGLAETYSNTIFITLKASKNSSLSGQGSLDDLKEICQLTLDLGWLQNFYHPDSPGRKPLVILKNKFFRELPTLTKFGEPVSFRSKAAINKLKLEEDAYFEFTNIEINETSAIVEFEYPIEGVFGKVVFIKSGKKWEIIEHSGGEY